MRIFVLRNEPVDLFAQERVDRRSRRFNYLGTDRDLNRFSEVVHPRESISGLERSPAGPIWVIVAGRKVISPNKICRAVVAYLPHNIVINCASHPGKQRQG